MNKCHLKVYLDPQDIYNKLSPDDKERFKNLEIIKSELTPDGSIEIDCHVYEADTKTSDILRQKLLSDGYLKV